MAKRPHCLLGRHQWVKRETSEGDVYGECTHCGDRDWGRFAPDDGAVGAPGDGVMPTNPLGSGGGAGSVH
jgi:hypothetical protein